MVTDVGDGSEKEEAKENDRSDDESGESTNVSHMQASNAVDVLMRYFQQSDDDMQPLSLIKRHMDYMRFCSQKQTMIWLISTLHY